MKRTKPTVNIEIYAELQKLTNAVEKLTLKVGEASIKQEGKYINVKEFTERYKYSSQWQKANRGLIKNKLPYYQNKPGGVIRYKISEVDEWMAKKKKGKEHN